MIFIVKTNNYVFSCVFFNYVTFFSIYEINALTICDYIHTLIIYYYIFQIELGKR
ncbi:hypothetical protein C8D90_11370 [Enterobacillus tribolii]|uniref:Uncharacterized protein n=1 Tax=Enterobacillus tribolii TaxID=1487935 RepID=A0A370Q896_9GAMM|nr:hypothetical protein C8D90_11370 [Enterobacillus tribolii]